MSLMRITVLISGRGSNLAALIAASQTSDFKGSVTHVVSSKPDASGLDVAHAQAIATSVVDSVRFESRDAFDASLCETIEAGEPDLIVLAGFMRVLPAPFVQRHGGRMLNVHPSLLPAYPGLHTHRRALADGVPIHGCTVHFVTATVDGGPIVAQAPVEVRAGDDEITLAARVLAQEHRLLPAAARWYCAGRLALLDGRVRIDAREAMDGVLLAPPVDAT